MCLLYLCFVDLVTNASCFKTTDQRISLRIVKMKVEGSLEAVKKKCIMSNLLLHVQRACTSTHFQPNAREKSNSPKSQTHLWAK